MVSRSQLEQIEMAEDRGSGQQEFALAFENHRPQIFRFLLASSRDVDTAEALTQECFLKAYCSWASFRGDSSVATWLTRIAINLQRDHWRNRRLQFWREARKNAVDPDEVRDWLCANQLSPEDQLLVREQIAHVWTAVKRLTDRQRTVFLLRFVEELQLSEIAQVTGLHEGTVKAHISRALKKVRREMGRGPSALRNSFAA